LGNPRHSRLGSLRYFGRGFAKLRRAALYRRIAFCGRSPSASALELLGALPITHPRYEAAMCAKQVQTWTLSLLLEHAQSRAGVRLTMRYSARRNEI